MREYDNGSGSPLIGPTVVTPAAAPSTSNGYGGYGNGGILETALVLGLLGNRGLGGYGYGNGCNSEDQVTAQNVSNLRKDVADTKTEVHKLGNEIQAAFATQTADLASNFRNLDNQICEADKNAIRAQYEGKIQTLESTNSILDKIDDRAIGIKDQLYGISTTMASEFCDLKHIMEKNTNYLSLQAERNQNATTLQIEREFNKLEEHRLRDEIAELRAQVECQRRDRENLNNTLLMSQQTNSILNAVDSQLQRQTSQIVQFGTGNTALPTTTSTNNTVN